MRRFLLTAPALCFSATVFASSFASFTGGPGDGYSSCSWRTYQPAALPAQMRFAGSGHDGYASSRMLSSWWQTNPAQERFAGSGYDGYASSKMLSSWWQTNPAQARFAGNGYDGYTSSKMLSSWVQTKPQRFFGGSFDGYDRNAALGISNWTVGDTDGNGLPDWWELKYFGVLTGTDPNADPDHDGVSNLNEYLAGTNPTNAASYFHVVSVIRGSPTKIFVTCEPGKVYTLLCADALATNWTTVTGQFRIPSSVEGVLEMDDASGDTNRLYRFYRVMLEY
jgi:hypothetical protein